MSAYTGLADISGSMLIHAQPEKVSEHWEFFAPILGRSLPHYIGASPERMAMLLNAILVEHIQVWVYDSGDGVSYVVTTTTFHEPVLGTPSLLIYTLSAVSDIRKDHWADGFETLKEFAKARKMHSIVAYSSDERLVAYANKIGARTNTTFIEFSI